MLAFMRLKTIKGDPIYALNDVCLLLPNHSRLRSDESLEFNDLKINDRRKVLQDNAVLG